MGVDCKRPWSVATARLVLTHRETIWADVCVDRWTSFSTERVNSMMSVSSLPMLYVDLAFIRQRRSFGSKGICWGGVGQCDRPVYKGFMTLEVYSLLLVQNTFQSVTVVSSSNNDSKGWEISGHIKANGRDLSSVRYLCLTRMVGMYQF